MTQEEDAGDVMKAQAKKEPHLKCGSFLLELNLTLETKIIYYGRPSVGYFALK